MYEQHHEFITPKDNTIIWHYMNVFKFIDLINSCELYFTRLDVLEDKYEGYLSNKSHANYNRLNRFINCWNINKGESDAMWKLYTDNLPGGIAIKCTVGKLKKALIDFAPVYIGKVNYIVDGIATGDSQLGSLYSNVVYKRSCFSFERELRMCVSPPLCKNEPNFDKLKSCLMEQKVNNISEVIDLCYLNLSNREKSIRVKVNLTDLIGSIRLSPTSTELEIKTISSLVKLNNIVTKIEKSSLNVHPTTQEKVCL